MFENQDYDDTVPLEYLNNGNPYAYCTDYHANSINLPDNKIRLSALQRIQPSKVSFRMPLRHVEAEKEYLINFALDTERTFLLKRAMRILKIEFHDSPEVLLEQNIAIPEILEIAIQIKKLKLFHHQKRLRVKISSALTGKITTETDYAVVSKGVIEIDNLKDALIYCKLNDLYNETVEEPAGSK